MDRLDRYVEQNLLPAYNRGRRRQVDTQYRKLTIAAYRARKAGEREMARQFNQQAQKIPSRKPDDPNFRRLWYVRYADDWLLGFTGPKSEAEEIKRQIAAFLRNELSLELSDEKTLITHARTEKAHFLGYEIHTLQANDKHDYRGQRCINGAIGLRVPYEVIQTKSTKYMRKGKPIHLMQRVNDTAVPAGLAARQAQMQKSSGTCSLLEFQYQPSLAMGLLGAMARMGGKVYGLCPLSSISKLRASIQTAAKAIDAKIGVPPRTGAGGSNVGVGATGLIARE